MKKQIGIRKCADMLKSANRVLIFTHISPDFDTVGSAMALVRALEKLGKTAEFVCSDELTPRFSLITDKTGTKITIKDPDLVVAVDMASASMLGTYRKEYGERVGLSIDHHGTSEFFAENTLCVPEASAAGEIIYRLIKMLGVELDEKTATYLYCAVSSDTGCFKFSNTTPKTHRIAAKLLEFGIDHAYLDRMMLDIRSKEQLELEKLCLDSMKYYANGRVAVLTFTQKMCKKAGTDITAAEALVQIPRTIDGVELGIVLKEKKKDEFKISLRSNDYFDCASFAASFGGGGHIRASGFIAKGKAEAVAHEIGSKAEEIIEKQDVQ